MLNSEFDLAFYDPCELNPHIFDIEEYYVDHLVALVPADHSLCKLKTIDLKLLAGERLLLMDNSTPIYDLYYSLFQKVGFEPNVYFTGVRIENFVEMVSNKMGIAILLNKHITNVNNNFAVIRDINPTATHTMSFARVKAQHHSTISKEFWNYMKENINVFHAKLNK